jgi:hypothetical protein
MDAGAPTQVRPSISTSSGDAARAATTIFSVIERVALGFMTAMRMT